MKANDVAAYIFQKTGTVSTMKLQKLAYYCQAWSLVWDDRPIFEDKIEAWANGPVVPSLYDNHKGLFEIKEWPYGNPDNLDFTAKETIDAVIKYYGDKTAQWLSDLTHKEQPWLAAREGLLPGERGTNEITIASMAEYYSSL